MWRRGKPQGRPKPYVRPQCVGNHRLGILGPSVGHDMRDTGRQHHRLARGERGRQAIRGGRHEDRPPRYSEASSSSSGASGASGDGSSTLTAIPYGRKRTFRVGSVLFLFARNASSSVAYTSSTWALPSSSTV